MKSREATAKRYAKALLDVAREGGSMEAVGVSRQRATQLEQAGD